MVRRMSGAVLGREPDLTPTALVGREGEEAAYWHLRQKGFIMVARNFRARGSHKEIDLIGWDGSTLVFVEVKTRGAENLLSPEAAVDREKERLLIAAAGEYRREARRLSAPFRFDIVSVLVLPEGKKVEHFRDVFRTAAAGRS
jgi:putative endonuclease